MIIDILGWTLIIGAFGFMLFVIWTLLYSAARWDEITEEQWREYTKECDEDEQKTSL